MFGRFTFAARENPRQILSSDRFRQIQPSAELNIALQICFFHFGKESILQFWQMISAIPASDVFSQPPTSASTNGPRLEIGGSSEDSDISSKPSFTFPQTFVVQICLKIGCSIAQRIENNTFLCRVEKCWRRWSWAILEFSYIRYHRGPRVKGVEDGITKI